ncbi:MAG: two-component system, OmpR family, sensor histidine kinase KdpD [Chloroflexota bacterium]|jgi:two-component system sensor histidine kinase KdpD|nr:two-component system, OmpR family, sensor histidine kinase KdpD [Chloroflexota bacterium]
MRATGPTWRWSLTGFQQGWIGYGAAIGAVAAISLVVSAALGRVPSGHISMLYLIAVLVTAVAFGRGPAIMASIAAFITFDWFFVEPLHTLAVADPEEWIALILFLLTAGVTGQLAADQRRRAREAEERKREATLLYEVVQLINEPDLAAALQAVVRWLHRELPLEAVAVELTVDGELTRSEAGDAAALTALQAQSAINAGLLALDSGSGRGHLDARRRWVRVVPPRGLDRAVLFHRDRLHMVRIGDRDHRAGALYLVRAAARSFGEVDTRLLVAIASQLDLAAERARLRREATNAEVLRRTDTARRALLGAVSHDLRTPLASIIAAAGSLRQTDVAWSEAERQEFAAAIEEEARRLNRIVGNLLDLSRIEAGSLRPETSWYDLGALIDDVVGRLAPMTARHRVRVIVPDDLPPVRLDYVEIDQVLSNILENAAKHAPVGTDVEIHAAVAGEAMQVRVADRGPGVPPGQLEAIFLPFRSLEGSRDRRSVGLGLAVARGLVEAHGGRIRAENRPDGGACFTFTLPLEIRGSTLPESMRATAGEAA